MFLDGVMSLWFVLTVASAIYLIWDQLVNTPSMKVMAFAWFLVILYTGPIGLFFYFLSCRQPLPGMHDAFIKAHWKQALGSEIHCVAGDATGIIISAFFMSFFAIPNGLETIIEYLFAYIFGLLIFQALFMISMYRNYGQAVLKTIFAETVSMNFVMIGMLPLVVILRHFWPAGTSPSNLEFWFIMSIATFGGFIIGYPINSYLVSRKEKHGMMSKNAHNRGAKTHSHEQSHHSGEDRCCKHGQGNSCRCKCDTQKKNLKLDGHNTNKEHIIHTEVMTNSHEANPHNHEINHEMHSHNHKMKHEMNSHEHSTDHHNMNHAMDGNMSMSEKWMWVIGSYVILVGVFFLISIWIPIRFS